MTTVGPNHLTKRTALFEQRVASQATVSSKALVCPAPCRAQGTAATTTPCSTQDTRGVRASMNTEVSPASSALHRRRPGPLS